jgi:two-component system, NtrC family, sensor kinase
MSKQSGLARAFDGFIRRPAWWPVLIAFWAAITAASFAWHLHSLETYANNSALQRGRLIFQMIETMRDWTAQQSQARGFADNSALMTRELGELLREERDRNLKIHITSLKLLNPSNTPDAWEEGALQDFESGGSERYGIDGDQFRYMAPLPTKPSCLVCHAHQGYQVGDVRGGISVTFPVSYVSDIIDAQKRSYLYIHIVAFAIFALLAWGSLTVIRRHVLALEATRGELVETEKMASLGRMVAGFAHEVNTPVGVAVGAVSQSQELVAELAALLDKEEVTEAELRERMDMLDETSMLALNNLRRASGMVQSFKRTAVDQLSETERDFDLAEATDDVRKNLHNQFKNTPIQITVSCPASIKLHGPVGALEQLLTNLLTNSRIHAFADGTRAGAISIAARQEGERIIIDYADDGAGMAPETLQHAFEPFFTTRRGSGGSGLGLYIAYNLATRNLGGTITCSSVPGQGTRFVVDMPFKAATGMA